MSAEEIERLCDTYSMPGDFEVEMSWDGTGLRFEWTPSVESLGEAMGAWPERDRNRFWKSYTKARRRFCRRVANEIGSNVLVMDMDGTAETIGPSK